MKSSVVIVRGQSWALSWHSAASWRHMQEPPNGGPPLPVAARPKGLWCVLLPIRSALGAHGLRGAFIVKTEARDF